MDGERLGQGRERARETLLNDPALLDSARLRVLDAMLKRSLEAPPLEDLIEEAA